MPLHRLLVLAMIVFLTLSFLLDSQPAHAATITVVDSGSVEFGSAIAILNGLPIISYYGNPGLKVVHCGNAACSSGNTINTVDSQGNVGFASSIAILNGLPIMAYVEVTNTNDYNVKVARCGNEFCSSGNTINTVDSQGNVGSVSAIAILPSGLPVIAYVHHGSVSYDLRVVRCGNEFCSSGNTITTVDSPYSLLTFPSIAILDGLPVISYWASPNSALRVVRCGDESCSSGNIITVVDNNTLNSEAWTSISVLNGLPIITYYANFGLTVARCGNAACSSGNTITVVERTGCCALSTSLAILNNLPVISYYSGYPTRDLKMARCGNAACSSGNIITTVDTPGDVGLFTSIAIVNNLPIISYFDQTNFDLKVAYPNPQPPTISQNNGLTITIKSSNNVIRSTRLAASDPDDGPTGLNFNVLTPPSQGSLSLGGSFSQAQINAGELTYTHTGSGDDRFVVIASDGYSNTAPATFMIHTAPGRDTVGFYRPATTQFQLLNYNNASFGYLFPVFGSPSMLPVVGDWNGDGVDIIGLYDPNTGQFFLRDSNADGAPIAYSPVLGIPGDTPIAGDWDGDGKDGIGVFRPSNGLIYLRQTPTSGVADFTMVLGVPGDVAVTGRWDNTMTHDGIGVYRPSTNMFFFSTQICNCGVYGDYQSTFGQSGDRPLVGDWDNDGVSGLGVFRPSTRQFLLRNSLINGEYDLWVDFGQSGDLPVAGHWFGALNVNRPLPTVMATSTPRLAPTFQPKR
jgi:hypothetical protein